jgi:hypothetical protein
LRGSRCAANLAEILKNTADDLVARAQIVVLQFSLGS